MPSPDASEPALGCQARLNALHKSRVRTQTSRVPVGRYDATLEAIVRLRLRLLYASHMPMLKARVLVLLNAGESLTAPAAALRQQPMVLPEQRSKLLTS